MTKLLYAVSAAMLVSAGILGMLCGSQWLQDAPNGAPVPELSGLRGSHGEGRLGDGIDQEAASPLIRQAMAFALYLKPPEPAAPKTPPRFQTVTQPAPKPPTVTPKFRILSTSYYRSSPEKSLALIAEPGKGGYWITRGDRLGHLVVENVKDGGIVVRDGTRMHEMAVTIKDTASLAQLRPRMSVAVRGGGSEIPSVNASRGAGVPSMQPIADEGLE